MKRHAPYAVGLAIGWVMLWDEITLANFLGGLAVATLLLVVFPLPLVPANRRLVVRPVALVRLAGAVLGELFVSNVFMTHEIVTRDRRLASGVVRCPMHTDSPKILSTVANILALAPGTMAVDATNGPPALYVHVLSRGDLGDLRRKVSRMERLVIDAIGSVEDRQAVAAGGAR
jgi:multicomponent Na+:H+ antiporter subunit E